MILRKKLQAIGRGNNNHKLATVLRLIGVRQPGNGVIGMKRLKQNDLWDLFERTKRIYRSRIAELHPDRGGTHEQCAALNDNYRKALKFFAQRGIPA